ncbi:hypothetical protein MKZ38_007360 [Zalerion maritima]|uniref:Chromo domain-containing protein n=1 Tax=Zalerion maritima TaxID=339359 RepID=A0AAD5RWU7_9PEZI|nr:hypothetical protein MKZ38_007360 [Zalerion maritima]
MNSRPPQPPPPPDTIPNSETKNFKPVKIEIPVPHYPNGVFPTYSRIPEIPCSLPRLAYRQNVSGTRGRARIDRSVVLPLHIPADVDLKKVKREFAYVVSWTDQPEVKVAVPGTEILEYVTPRTLEDFEFGEWVKREDKRAREEREKEMAGGKFSSKLAIPVSVPVPGGGGAMGKNKKGRGRGRPPKKNAMTLLEPPPSPPRAKTMVVKGPSLSTPQKTKATLATAATAWDDQDLVEDCVPREETPCDSAGLEVGETEGTEGQEFYTSDEDYSDIEPPPRKRSRGVESGGSRAARPSPAPIPRSNPATSSQRPTPTPKKEKSRSRKSFTPSPSRLSRHYDNSSSSRLQGSALKAAGSSRFIPSSQVDDEEQEEDAFDGTEEHTTKPKNNMQPSIASSSGSVLPRVVAGPLSDYVPPPPTAQHSSSIPPPPPPLPKYKSKPPEEEEIPEQAWEVKALEGDKYIDGHRHYLVRWKGDWPLEENPTWEPKENISWVLIKAYLRMKKEEANRDGNGKGTEGKLKERADDKRKDARVDRNTTREKKGNGSDNERRREERSSSMRQTTLSWGDGSQY